MYFIFGACVLFVQLAFNVYISCRKDDLKINLLIQFSMKVHTVYLPQVK